MTFIVKLLITLSGIFVVLIGGIVLFNFIKNFSGGGGAPVAKQIDLEYWGLQVPEEVMNELLVEYKKDNPDVNIKYTKKPLVDISEYRSRLAESLRQGIGPSIFTTHPAWISYLNNQISLTTNVVDEDRFKEIYFEASRSPCTTQDNEVKCLPIMYDGLVLVYNKNLFATAGLSTPLTWEDVRDAALRIAKKSNGEEELSVGGVALGSVNNIPNAVDIIALMFLQSGVNGLSGLDSEQTVTAVNYFLDFSREDKVWDETMPDSITAFAIEKVGMAIVNTEQINMILEINPTINMGITTVPQLPTRDGKTTNINLATGWVEAISSDLDSDEDREAWRFLYWLSSPEQQEKLHQINTKYKKIGNAYGTKSNVNKLLGSPVLGPVIKSAETSKYSQFVSNAGNNEFNEKFIEMIIEIEEGRRSEEVYEILKKYKLELQDIQKKGF